MRYSHALHLLRRTIVFPWKTILFVVGFLIILILFLEYSGIVTLDRTLIIKGFLYSLIRVSIAYFIAFILAIFFAILATANKTIEKILLPFFDVMQSFPSFVLFPILVSAIKNQPDMVIILVLVISMIWPLLFAIISGIKGRRTDLEEAATIFGATGLKRFFNFILPMLLPSIITGSIVSWGEGWEFIIGAELLVTTNFGIGKYLGQISTNGNSFGLAYGVAIMLLLLFIINKLIWLPLLQKSTEFQTDV